MGFSLTTGKFLGLSLGYFCEDKSKADGDLRLK